MADGQEVRRVPHTAITLVVGVRDRPADAIQAAARAGNAVADAGHGRQQRAPPVVVQERAPELAACGATLETVGDHRSPPSFSAVAPRREAGCCGVAGPSPSAAL